MTSPTDPPETATFAPHRRVVSWAALAWSTALSAMGIGWAGGVLPLTVPTEKGFGSVFVVAGPLAATVCALTLAVVGVLLSLATWAPHSRWGRPVEIGAWSMAATTLALFVDGQVLAWLGYCVIMPVVGWVVPGLAATWLTLTLDPVHLTMLFFVLGVGIWVVLALRHRRSVNARCVRCGRGHGWNTHVERRTRARALRVGRGAVAVACVTALLYPALRLPWLFGVVVGMSPQDAQALMSDPQSVLVGVGLGSAGVAGAVLTLGLVQGWGVRFPRWMVGLAGRRVPVPLAVLPAAVVAIALVAIGRGALLQVVTLPGSALNVHSVVFVSMGLWGAALGVATAAYAVRRRVECGVCGRGLPEAWPVPVADPAGEGVR